jgi:hypothetical protein
VWPVSITHRDHFVNVAKRKALEANLAKMDAAAKRNDHVSHKEQSDETSKIVSRGGYFADQFKITGPIMNGQDLRYGKRLKEISMHLLLLLVLVEPLPVCHGFSRLLHFSQIKFYSVFIEKGETHQAN